MTTYIRLAVFLCLLLGSCIARHPAASTQPATATADYWYSQPPTATVEHWDFDRVFQATQHVAEDYLFRLDRVDYRLGLITTDPLVSRQFFEFWRPDAQRAYDVSESSLSTVRRTIRFEFRRLDLKNYSVTPKVLVERYCIRSGRITTVGHYQSAAPTGTPSVGMADPGYWYALRRDSDLEKRLARSIEDHLREKN